MLGKGRVLARFGSVRVREFVGDRDAGRAGGEASGLVDLHFVRSGGIHVGSQSRVLRLRAGDAFLTRGDDELRASEMPGLRLVTVTVPPEVIPGSVLPRSGQIRHIASSALLEPAVAFAERIATADVAPDDSFTVYYAERLLQEMVIGISVETAGPSAAVLASDLMREARGRIAAQFTDPELTPARLAQQLGVSLRRLQRTFSAAGTTIEREIRSARVDHAISLLSDEAYDRLNIAEVAGYAGFSGTASLSRALRTEDHGSPSTLRRAARSRRQRVARAD